MTDPVQRLTQGLADDGKIIEAGWLSYLLAVLPPNAGPIQIDETRKAFFAGAQHLFSSIMVMLDPDAEASEADLHRMTLIHQELESYIAEFAAARAKLEEQAETKETCLGCTVGAPFGHSGKCPMA